MLYLTYSILAHPCNNQYSPAKYDNITLLPPPSPADAFIYRTVALADRICTVAAVLYRVRTISPFNKHHQTQCFFPYSFLFTSAPLRER